MSNNLYEASKGGTYADRNFSWQRMQKGLLALACTQALFSGQAEAFTENSGSDLNGQRVQQKLSLNQKSGRTQCRVKLSNRDVMYNSLSSTMYIEEKTDNEWSQNPDFTPYDAVSVATGDQHTVSVVNTGQYNIKALRQATVQGPTRLTCYAGQTQISHVLTKSMFKR